MFGLDYEILIGAAVVFSAVFLFVRRLRKELMQRSPCEGCKSCDINFDK